jgi:hypothetical protein
MVSGIKIMSNYRPRSFLEKNGGIIKTRESEIERKEVTKMKKILSILTIVGLVLAFGTAYAEVDSLINILDPSSVPGYVDLETGAATLPAPQALFTERGSAAGGMGIEPDTFLRYIDPSTVPGYVNLETGVVVSTRGPTAFREFQARGSAAGGIGMEPDTFPNYIDPSRMSGYVDLETGVIN